MGSKNKLKRFRENDTFSNVVQPSRAEAESDGLSLKGNWNKNFFKNDNPIVLELGCTELRLLRLEYDVNSYRSAAAKFLRCQIRTSRDEEEEGKIKINNT